MAFDFNNKDLDASLSTTPIPISEGAHPPYITVEIYENQRWLPLSKWTGRRRLPTDRPLYSNKSGTEELSFTNFRLPPGYVFGSPPNSPNRSAAAKQRGHHQQEEGRMDENSHQRGVIEEGEGGEGKQLSSSSAEHPIANREETINAAPEVAPPSDEEIARSGTAEARAAAFLGGTPNQSTSSTSAAVTTTTTTATSFPAASSKGPRVQSPTTPVDVIANEWQIEISDRTDREGWRYAVDYKAHFDKEMHPTSLVRRRRYFRTAIYTGGRGVEGTFDFGGSGAANSKARTAGETEERAHGSGASPNAYPSSASAAGGDMFFSSSGVGAVVRDVGFVHVSKSPGGSVFAQSGAETIHENIIKKYNQDNRVIGNERTEPIDPFDIPYHQIPRRAAATSSSSSPTYAAAASGSAPLTNKHEGELNVNNNNNKASEGTTVVSDQSMFQSARAEGTTLSSPIRRHNNGSGEGGRGGGFDVSSQEETRQRLQHEASVAALAQMKREEEEREREREEEKRKAMMNMPRNPFVDADADLLDNRDATMRVRPQSGGNGGGLGPTGTNYESYRSTGRSSIALGGGGSKDQTNTTEVVNPFLLTRDESFTIPPPSHPATAAEGPSTLVRPSFAPDVSFDSKRKEERCNNNTERPHTQDQSSSSPDLLFTSQSGTYVVANNNSSSPYYSTSTKKGGEAKRGAVLEGMAMFDSPAKRRENDEASLGGEGTAVTVHKEAEEGIEHTTAAAIDFGALQQDTSAARFDAVFSAFVAKEGEKEE